MSEQGRAEEKERGEEKREERRGRREEKREKASLLKLDRLAGTERMRLIHADEL